MLSIGGILNLAIEAKRQTTPASGTGEPEFPTRNYEASTVRNKLDGALRGGTSYPHPSMLAFDAPSREECRREPPNIPRSSSFAE